MNIPRRVRALIGLSVLSSVGWTPASAQWVDNGPSMHTFDDVTIGTTWPLAPLAVFGWDDAVALYALNAGGDGYDPKSGIVGNTYGIVGAGVVGNAGFDFEWDTAGVLGQNFGLSPGVKGTSAKGVGVIGIGETYMGVYGRGWDIGVHGFGGWGNEGGIYNKGVWGEAYGPKGVGVLGDGDAYGMKSIGNFAATGAKAFLQPHPKDPRLAVQFISLEGNESGTYFRGTARLARGRAMIPIPEEWRLVTEQEGITVQLTPHGPANVWVASSSRDRIVVAGSDDVEFDYMVNGVRRGFADYKPYVENDSFRPTVRGVPFGTEYPRALRDILVQNGILNADYTPNEATAARLGWELRDPDDVPLEQRSRLAVEALSLGDAAR